MIDPRNFLPTNSTAVCRRRQVVTIALFIGKNLTPPHPKCYTILRNYLYSYHRITANNRYSLFPYLVKLFQCTSDVCWRFFKEDTSDHGSGTQLGYFCSEVWQG